MVIPTQLMPVRRAFPADCGSPSKQLIAPCTCNASATCSATITVPKANAVNGDSSHNTVNGRQPHRKVTAAKPRGHQR